MNFLSFLLDKLLGRKKPPTTKLPRLRVSGKELLDHTGTPILLRGFNWGRWGAVQPGDAADHKAQGANAVRIPLRWWGAYESIYQPNSRNDTAPGFVNPDHLKMLDDMVNWAVAQKLWIVLFIDSDCGQDGTQNDNERSFCDPEGKYPNGHNFWTDREMRAKFIEVWKFIANRYKDTPYIAMFELLPEPDPKKMTDTDIAMFYIELMAEVQKVTADVPFLIGGRTYGTGAAASSFIESAANVVYTGNLFAYTDNTPQGTKDNFDMRLQRLLDLRDQKNVPIFIQQVGVRTGEDPTQELQRHMLQRMNEKKVGWTWWEFRSSNSADDYGVNYRVGDTWVVKTAVKAVFNDFF